MNKKFIIFAIVLCLSLSFIFADGENKVAFKELDLSICSAEEMVEALKNDESAYTEQVKALLEAQEEALFDRDVNEYLRLRTLIKSVERPVITKENFDTIKDRMLKSEDEEEKKALYEFLSTYTFYRPTVTFVYENNSGSSTRKYSFTVSKNPGEKVSAPSQKGLETIEGWGDEDGNVVLKYGEEMDMPYGDITLYAITETGIDFVDNYGDGTRFVEETEAELVTPTTEDDLVFSGWYNAKGEKIEKAEGKKGQTVQYYAGWTGVEELSYYVENVGGIVRTGEKTPVILTLKTKGNVTAEDVTLSLKSQDNLEVSEDVVLKSVKPGALYSKRVYITATGESGDKVETTLTYKDKDGNEKEEKVAFLIR